MVRIQIACAVIGMSLVFGCGGGSKPTLQERASRGAKAGVEDSSAASNVAASEPVLEAVPVQSEPGEADFPRGSEAFAELVKAAQANDGEAWNKAEAKLHELGSSATAALAARLDDKNPVARELAAMFLAQIGPDASPAAKGLLTLLTDESTFARVNAAAALSTFDGYAEQTAPILTDLLSDPDENVRLTAALSLRNVGPAATKSVGNLVRVLGDPNPQIRAAAATTLGELGSAAAVSLPALRRLGTDSDEAVVTAASHAIRLIAEATREQNGLTIPASATE
jgi:HEAT repeat protein